LDRSAAFLRWNPVVDSSRAVRRATTGRIHKASRNRSSGHRPFLVPTILPTSRARWPLVITGDEGRPRGHTLLSPIPRCPAISLTGFVLVANHHPPEPVLSLAHHEAPEEPIRPVTPEVASSSLVGPATSFLSRPFRAVVFFVTVPTGTRSQYHQRTVVQVLPLNP
jgi:hypothetical protein